MNTQMNSIAEVGFGKSAESYVQGRPSYPREAVDWLIEGLRMGAGSRVLELGAGTGKFTELLLPTGAQITALEPVSKMREMFRQKLPQIKIVDGTAESIPFAESTFDFVFVAQSFHWFNGLQAQKEIYRVLRPGGGLGLIWNSRDENLQWVKKLTGLLDPYERGAPRYRTGNWKVGFECSSQFAPLKRESFTHTHQQTLENFLNRILSISFISVLETHEKQILVDQLKKLILAEVSNPLPEFVELPYITDVYFTNSLKI